MRNNRKLQFLFFLSKISIVFDLIFDFYLNAGIIQETGLAAPFAYKLAPRRTAEGSMAFGSVTMTVTTVSDALERIFDL